MYRVRDAPPLPLPTFALPVNVKPGNNTVHPIKRLPPTNNPIPGDLTHSDPREGLVYEPHPKRGRGRGGGYQQMQGSYPSYNGRPQWIGRISHSHGQEVRPWNNNRQPFNGYQNGNCRPPPYQHFGQRHARPFTNFNQGRGGHYSPYTSGPRYGNIRHNFHGHNQGHYGGGQGHQDHGKDSPWMTPELLKLIQEKEDLWKICSETRSEDDHRNFKIKRFEVNLAVNDAKLLFHQQNPPIGNSYTQVFRRTVKNTEFYCEPCEKDFISEEQLNDHKTEHITCKLDGCTYTAHVKLVMKHIEIQHSTNLFERIKGYDTPEEIEKWKHERKKNFPTPENIARKIAEIAERKNRGESLTAKEDFPGIEVFRHKIVPEERQSRRNNFHQGYQSEGDEDYVPAYCLRPGAIRLMSFNSSPAIRLHNFYTDIALSASGTLIASTRETWINQCTKGNIELNKSQEDLDAAAEKEFNITDDEEDMGVRKVGFVRTPGRISESQSSQGSIEIAKSTTPNCNSLSNEMAEGTNLTSNIVKVSHSGNVGTGLAGLVSYGSEVDSDMEEDGETKSDGDEAQNKHVPKILKSIPCSGIDPPLSSGDEAPDEVPTIVLKEATTPINSDPCNSSSQLNQNNHSQDKSDCQSRKNFKNKRDNPRRSRKAEKRAFPQTHFQRAQSVRRKYTLLQRLLAPDIRKEKNMVLQVCRFLVDRNFLDSVGQENECNNHNEDAHSTPSLTPWVENPVPSCEVPSDETVPTVSVDDEKLS